MELWGVVIHISHLDVHCPFDHLESQGQQQGVSFESLKAALWLCFGALCPPQGAAVTHSPLLPSARATDREMRIHTHPLAVTDRKFNREF